VCLPNGAMSRPADERPRILVLDIGGTHVKAVVSDRPGYRVRFPSGSKMSAEAMVRQLRPALRGREFDRVAVGYPGLVRRGRIVRDPPHLGAGWVGFDFARALGRPARVVNDAAMQALGSYRGGRMLFLGLGAGLGSAMMVDGSLIPMELGHLPYRKGRCFEEFVGETARRRLGRKKWRKEVVDVVETLRDALEPEYIVLGGGNVHHLKRLPAGTERGDNANAFVGGVRLWERDYGVFDHPSSAAQTAPSPRRSSARRRTRA